MNNVDKGNVICLPNNELIFVSFHNEGGTYVMLATIVTNSIIKKLLENSVFRYCSGNDLGTLIFAKLIWFLYSFIFATRYFHVLFLSFIIQLLHVLVLSYSLFDNSIGLGRTICLDLNKNEYKNYVFT